MTDTDINDAVQTALEKFDENLAEFLAENVDLTSESIFNDADLLRKIMDKAPSWHWVEHERQRVIQDALDGEPEKSERAIEREEEKMR